MIAANDHINTLKVRRIQCGDMAYYLTSLEEKFDSLVDEGETLTPNFKI